MKSKGTTKKSSSKENLEQKVIRLVKEDQEILRYIEEIDPDAMRIFEYLVKNGKVLESKIVSDLKYEKANYLRKILYKMYEKNIVGYKERKKGKILEYIWFANLNYLLEVMIKKVKEEIFKIEREIDLEKIDNYYRCPQCLRTYNESTALENNFLCIYCNIPLKYIDSKEIMNERERILEQLNKRQKELLEFKKKITF
ncbi:MAG: hypothetical protein QXJ93_02765 [Candidatus Rehaiarchaeum fermentans]|nr:hypothetical protein [Candidatus Rehaiarchaeum fermentans]MCW1293536.1 hypothetical protein [Candidatus Rehaiarchaeum fermentans]MCW1311749.1 hypothetical protein [Candidatus Rehaiarchaeum fermentans]